MSEASPPFPSAQQRPGGRARSRLEAIQAGEAVETVTHDAVWDEPACIEIEHFDLWYGDKQALRDVTLRIPERRITALIGPSGCGKSTLLRAINRLNDLVDGARTRGDLRLFGESVYDRRVDVIALRKRMGMVFQKPNPFPMSIYENVVYPLRVDGERRRAVLDEACERALRAAALWGEVEDRLGDSALRLSGGQQQRLCIARAIVGEPEVLLMDEPCSALDPIATGRIEDLMDELRARYSIVLVTHSMQQASRTSDYTGFLYLGRLVEHGPTEAVFRHPRLRETEDYISGRFW